MELADLMRIFREAQNEERKRGALTQGACDAAGILAVVGARAMTDIVKGMVVAFCKEMDASQHDSFERVNEAAMRSALLWLADNVSDEMVQAYRNERESVIRDEWFPSLAEAKTLAAAIRAAAGEGSE